MDDRADFTDADRGLITPLPEKILSDRGEVIRDGSHQVVDGLYQIRFGGRTSQLSMPPNGLVVSTPVAVWTWRRRDGAVPPRGRQRQAGRRGDLNPYPFRPPRLRKGVIDEADGATGKIPIVAPGTIPSFDKFGIGENVITARAMSRRMGYTFGSFRTGTAGWARVGLGMAQRGRGESRPRPSKAAAWRRSVARAALPQQSTLPRDRRDCRDRSLHQTQAPEI